MSTPIFTNLTKHDVCLKVLTFTPDSSLSPPHQEDSEDESSFMTHTQVDDQCDHKLIDDQLDHNLMKIIEFQFDALSSFQHLVDVMEARIKQVIELFKWPPRPIGSLFKMFKHIWVENWEKSFRLLKNEYFIQLWRLKGGSTRLMPLSSKLTTLPPRWSHDDLH